MSPIVTQLIGFLGLLAFVISYQVKSNRWLYVIQLAGVLLFTLQFALLGAVSGCFSLALTALRNILLYKYNDWSRVRRKLWPILLCGAFTAVLILTWAGPISLLSYAASVVSTVCYWTNDPRKLRAANLFVSSPCWIVYDLLVGSWGGFFSEALTMLSIIVSIIRFGWKKMGDPESGFRK